MKQHFVSKHVMLPADAAESLQSMIPDRLLLERLGTGQPV